MARFCFVSVRHPAHCDFGGHAFVRTARRLIERGHEVIWLFSQNPLAVSRGKATELLATYAIPVEQRLEPQLLPMYQTLAEVPASIAKLSDYLIEGGFHCAVIDRSCSAASFSAHLARIPWATVGSDGRDWVRSKQMEEPRAGQPESDIDQRLRVMFSAFVKSGYPQPSTHSCYATSPFLNLSFFPRRLYPEYEEAPIPVQSHFLGRDPNDPFQGNAITGFSQDEAGQQQVREHRHGSLLLTFGNTMPMAFQRQLLDILTPVIKKRGIKTLILTGGGEMATALVKQRMRWLPQVEVVDWKSYDSAFANARVAIGHGGASFLWHGIKAATPMLAVPWLADQWFGAMQIERLGIGEIAMATDWFGGPVGRFPQRSRLDANEVLDSFDRLWSPDPGSAPNFAESLRKSSVAMHSGGGTLAASLLLEQLAGSGMPVTRCREGACCC